MDDGRRTNVKSQEADAPCVPSRRTKWVLGLVAVQLAALVATFFVSPLGTRMWHHVASLGFALAVSAVLWRPLVASRRFLALGVLTLTVLATVSGFYLLYWKEGIRIDGYQDWGVFWHILWSWFATVFFTMHTWINRRQLANFWRRSFATLQSGAVHVSLYAMLVVLFLVTWSTSGRTWFDNENYIQISLYAWLLFAVPPYLAWNVVRLRQRSKRSPRWVEHWFGHWRVRGGIDLALVPMTVLAVLSGIPLAFMDAFLDPRGFKYVSKVWHVWPSILFAVLVFVHAVQAWPTVRAHWRRYGARRSKPARPGADLAAEPIDKQQAS